MKSVTCRCCGEIRVSAKADEDCSDCGCNEITFRMGAVPDLVNSRESATLNCTSCGREVFGLNVDAYSHENGWRVPGLKGKWWLSIACPDCHHESSFSHFGITR